MATERNSSTAVVDSPRPQRTSHASRDFSESREVLDRIGVDRPVVYGRPVAPVRTTRTEVPLKKRKRENSRLGSKQVLTHRGRRVSEIKQVSAFARASGWAIALLIAGIALAMFFSGESTSQTFRIQQLTYQESQLNNQLETLNRDLEAVRSSADVARRAADARLGVPVQPGIIQVNPDGTTTELRPATPELESVIDINGQAIRPNRASSDPAATRGVTDSLQAVPQTQQSTGGEQVNVDEVPAGAASDAAAEEAAPQPQPLPQAVDMPYEP